MGLDGCDGYDKEFVYVVYSVNFGMVSLLFLNDEAVVFQRESL